MPKATNPEETILIRCERDIEHKDGSVRWRKGAKLATTEAELKARGVPSDAYRIVRRAGATGSESATGSGDEQSAASSQPTAKADKPKK